MMQKGDFTNASLTIRHALDINPQDVATNRLAAEIAEKEGDASAVIWRRQLVYFQPKSLSAVLECADTALRFGQADLASEMLMNAYEIGKQSPQFHGALGRTATAMEQPELAVQHFAKAAKLDLQNENLELMYAAALLERGWLEDRSESRATLERLMKKPALRIKALRALIRDSIANYELLAAVSLSRKLVTTPEAEFADRLTLVGLLRRTGMPEFLETLDELKSFARNKPTELVAVLFWMNGIGWNAEALAWADTFTAAEWSDPRVCAAAAVCCCALQDWPQLEKLTKGNWQFLEYLRSALQARASREQGNFVAFNADWSAAVASALKQPGALRQLAELIQDWKWPVQYKNLLEVAVDSAKGDWALPSLLALLASEKNTAALREATARFLRTHPDSDAAANNFAMYSLLLGRDIPENATAAKALYDKHPLEARYVSTYAFSLLLRELPEQALQVMETLPLDDLEKPDIAAYYGIILSATKAAPRAAKFLEHARHGDFLPEEVQLIDLARQRANAQN